MYKKEICVTCFIITYIDFDKIYRAIDSILCQDYVNIEIAVFDDGTPNFPEKEIAKYIYANKKNNIKNIIVSHNPSNQGIVKNLNRMIKATHGDIIVGFGQDDILYDKSVVSDAVIFFNENNSLLVASKYKVIDVKGDVVRIGPSLKSVEKWKRCTSEEQFRWIAVGAPIMGVGLLYSRRVFELFGNFDERYCMQEDGPFLLRATRAGIHIDFFDRITVFYQLGKGVSSGEKLHPKLIEDIHRMFAEEIDPYCDRLSIYERRLVKYEKERLAYGKKLGFNAILLFVKYPDVMIYRRIFAK